MSVDTLAEQLRRRPAKPMGSPRVGSNPTGVDVAKGCARRDEQTHRLVLPFDEGPRYIYLSPSLFFLVLFPRPLPFPVPLSQSFSF